MRFVISQKEKRRMIIWGLAGLFAYLAFADLRDWLGVVIDGYRWVLGIIGLLAVAYFTRHFEK